MSNAEYATCRDMFPAAPFGLDFIPPWVPDVPALQAVFASQGEAAAVAAAEADYRGGRYHEWRGCARSNRLE